VGLEVGGQLKKSSELIGNRTRDLPGCSIVLQVICNPVPPNWVQIIFQRCIDGNSYLDTLYSKLLSERMASSGMLRRVALVRTDVSEELSASIIRVTRIGELGT
jgi:hypothetical protein